MCCCFIVQPILMMTAKNIPVLKVYCPFNILYLSVDWYALSLFGLVLPQLEKLRVTGSVFQSLKLNLTVFYVLRNFRNMFVTLLLVFSSVNHSFEMDWSRRELHWSG